MQKLKIKIKKKKALCQNLRFSTERVQKKSVKKIKIAAVKKPKANLAFDNSTSRTCPSCKISLLSTIFYNIEIDYCQKCLGIWFDEEELRWAKDAKDENLRWLDIDIWENKKQFKVSYGARK